MNNLPEHLKDKDLKAFLKLGEELRMFGKELTGKGWCPDCGKLPEICQYTDCPSSLLSVAWVNGDIDHIDLTECDPSFLNEMQEAGDAIELNTMKIAMRTRDYIKEHEIEAQQVYYEVATYSLRGRSPRTVRYWVEAIRGFSDKSLKGWREAGLTMSHFEAARKLARDEHIEAPAIALDACINQREHSNRPLTVDQMISLFDPAPPANEQIAEFREWLENVLNRKPPFGWNEKKIREFSNWQEEGKRFLK